MKSKIFLFSILISLSISFNSCSDDDESPKFLYKYGGSIWTLTNNRGNYYRINNDENNPIEAWIGPSGTQGKYWHYSFFSEDNKETKIIEHKENKFVVSYFFHSDPNNTIFTTTYKVIDREKMTVKSTKGGELSSEETYERTQVNLYDLPLH